MNGIRPDELNITPEKACNRCFMRQKTTSLGHALYVDA